MHSKTISVARGAAAGLIGCVVQAAVGGAESALFLPEHEDANFAPRLMDRLARDVGTELPLEAEWALGTLFHLGYGAFWGALYGLADDRFDIPPLVGGAALGGVIYGITFPDWGAAVQTEVERPQQSRTRRMSLVVASVTMGFGFATVYTNHLLKRRPWQHAPA
jgi:ribose/xylose/arabinose/galactoside ABC-type transport system permease subunit